jgi:Inositol polyphosphate kinase
MEKSTFAASSCFIIFFFSFFFLSSLLLVYEGRDSEAEHIDALMNANYDADISNCSTDHNDDDVSHHAFCSSNDENDGEIGHDDETTNMDQSLYEEAGNLEDIDHEQINPNKFLEPVQRAPSPSMDSWINYCSNSSDEYSTQDLIVRKGIKLNLHDDDVTQDNDDVDVYDKINFVNAKSISSSFKKSKMEPAKEGGLEILQKKFSQVIAPSTAVQNDMNDCIRDGKLSSLSSNIDAIIVSESIETKYFKVSGEEHIEHPSVKKKKSCEDATLTVTCTSTTNGHSNTKIMSPLVDVRIIDFAHTTFKTNEPSPFEDVETKKVSHHGPDGGFLTGILSLKRILTDIMATK